jgi:uncharacterized protein (TIGR03083 family)
MGALMPGLGFGDYCSEIVTQTELLSASIDGADMTVRVPSCPDWNVGQLVRHLGGAQRWAADMVRTGATEPLPDNHFRDLSAFPDEDSAVLAPWLLESATALTGALRAVGPDAPVTTGPIPDGVAAFYARRFTHETAIHRADAVLALGEAFTLEPDVAVDCLDEWMELGSLPMHFEWHPWTRELLGPGRTLHFHATDTDPDRGAEWVVDLTGDALAWRRAHEKSAVAVRGPLVELLLVVYRRRSPNDGTVEVLGDPDLLDFWLERVSFE